MTSTFVAEQPARTPTVGVGYVRGATGREALRSGYGIASNIDAQLRVISVVQPSLHMYAGVRAALPAESGTDLQDVEGALQLHLQQELSELVTTFGDFVAVTIDTFVGDPAQTLIDASKNLELLVCGSRGQGPVRSAVLGSVSRRVTAEARCPVLVLPPGVVAPLDGLFVGTANTPRSSGSAPPARRITGRK